MSSHKSVTVSAPGKLLLLGDHAVVHDHPCLVAAVETRLKVTIEQNDAKVLRIDAPDIGLSGYTKQYAQLANDAIPAQAGYIEYAVREFFKDHRPPCGIRLASSSQFDSRFGFGSSAATLAATVSSLNEFFDTELQTKQLFQIAYRAMHEFKGVGSGADIAASLYGSILYFVTAGKTIQPVSNAGLKLLAVYSGQKADTPTILQTVALIRARDHTKTEALFSQSTQLVERGKHALEGGDMKAFGMCMSENQRILQDLGVSTPELDRICKLAEQNGAFGAKLSGAGGGDCAIVATNSEELDGLMAMYEKEGFEVIEVKVANEGVRFE